MIHFTIVQKRAVGRKVDDDNIAALVLNCAVATGNNLVRIGQNDIVLVRTPHRQRGATH